MIFPSEKKKELWRYASRNNPAMSDGLPIQSPQPLHPQHRLHPQRMGEQRLSIGSRISCNDESFRLAQTSTPPPPYNCIDCSGSYSQNSNHRQRHQHHQHQHHHNRLDGVLAETKTDIYADFLPTEDSDSDHATRAVNTYTKGGGSGCESSNDDSLNERRSGRSQQEPPRMELPSPPPNLHSIQTNNRFFPIATSAANMFRNCCGGSHANESSSSISHQSGIPSTSHTNPQQHPSHTAANSRHSIPLTSATRKRKEFDAFMKLLKHKQHADLLRAVKSRVDLPGKTNSAITGGGNVVVPYASPSYLKCILIKCTTIATEEDLHHVTACRLFFWPDLRNGAELKRLPLCPNAGDSVYACCNPLHWFRILHLIDAESEPPPYHRSKMLRLRDADSEEDFPNVEKSIMPTWMAPIPNSGRSSSSISSIIKQTTTTTESQLFGPSLESFTTDGKDRTAYSKGWCQIAYWELAQRVGEFFYAKEPAVNIFTEGPDDFGGDSMCLLDLKASAKAKSSDAVQNTRQKVGLGVTLSLESNDVWIYNRGNVPIFVDSPTLAKDMDRVCKVMPGYCLKAFQIHRAQSLAGRQPHHPHLGPIDQFSMKISFAKGWGNTYRRQDIMGCPCWLEVHFTCLR
ncbi:mothers against decapentaplegic homolog 6 [Drosophila tropicalis]|uniref:mothers against decapentaplegic homolog 6 n=1 Tax=Drosophila tropicalis TaxID=46794 RepID=UPI0035ABCCB0